MLLKEKFNVTHSFHRHERYVMPWKAQRNTMFSQETERNTGEA